MFWVFYQQKDLEFMDLFLSLTKIEVIMNYK